MSMVVKAGWNGRFFEDFAVGDVYKHTLGRTITATDNAWFTLLTQNTAPLHFDANYAAHTSFKRPLVNSCLTIALVTALAVGLPGRCPLVIASTSDGASPCSRVTSSGGGKAAFARTAATGDRHAFLSECI